MNTVQGYIVANVDRKQGKTYYVDRNMWWDTGDKKLTEAFVHASLEGIYRSMTESPWQHPPNIVYRAEWSPEKGTVVLGGPEPFRFGLR